MQSIKIRAGLIATSSLLSPFLLVTSASARQPL